VKRLVIIASIIVAVILQSTICSLWPWIGIKPELVTVIVIITGLFYGLVPGSMVGFIGGFLLDYATGRLIGASAVSKMLVGGLSGWIAPKIFGDHLVVPPLAVLVGTWLEQSIYLLLANAFGSGLPVVRGFWTIVLPVGLVNVIFSFPVYYYLLALDNMSGRGGSGGNG
jgi:rod shape-determining protein MreD